MNGLTKGWISACAFVFACAAQATPIVGQGSPSDDAFLSASTLIDFESVGVFNGTSLTIEDVVFSGNSDIEIDSDYAGGFNTRGTYHMTNHGDLPSMFRFDFLTSVDAFGFLFGASDVVWELAAYGSGGLLESMTIDPVRSSNAGDYFGLATTGIKYATLTSLGGDNDYVFVDDFSYVAGKSVPVPASIGLLGLGLLALRLRKSR